jgi:hypothetical protein
VWIEDVERAQRFADRLASVIWPRVLNRYARRINPHMDKLLGRMDYYWVTAQCEWATDGMFRYPSALRELYPRLISHSMQCFGTREVMNFLRKKLVGQFRGAVVSDITDRQASPTCPLSGRLAGRQCTLLDAGHRRRPPHGDPATALDHRTQTNP